MNCPVKTRGTIIEQECKKHLQKGTGFNIGGSSASGLDLPIFNTDIKVTDISRPQSSSPYKSVSEKLFGLSYNLLLFIYNLSDTNVEIKHAAYIPKEATGCKNGTKLIKKLYSDFEDNKISKKIAIKALKGWLFNVDNETPHSITNKIKSYYKNNLSAKEFTKNVREWSVIEPIDVVPNWNKIWKRVKNNPPQDGLINYSFALQWRLQYSALTKSNYLSNIAKIK